MMMCPKRRRQWTIALATIIAIGLLTIKSPLRAADEPPLPNLLQSKEADFKIASNRFLNVLYSHPVKMTPYTKKEAIVWGFDFIIHPEVAAAKKIVYGYSMKDLESFVPSEEFYKKLSTDEIKGIIIFPTPDGGYSGNIILKTAIYEDTATVGEKTIVSWENVSMAFLEILKKRGDIKESVNHEGVLFAISVALENVPVKATFLTHKDVWIIHK